MRHRDLSCPGTSRISIRPAPRRHGFGLLELVVTLSLLSSLALGVALLLVPLVRQSRLNRETSTASLVARSFLERIQATPFRKLHERFPAGTRIRLPELADGEIRVSYPASPPGTLVIKVEMEWESTELGTMRYTFHTARTQVW